tara:strand:+ start:1637 stop:2185 length:549 start_codon:yes stop_codon:yes gene_type:complete
MKYFILLLTLFLYSCNDSNYIKKYKLSKKTIQKNQNLNIENSKLYFSWDSPDLWIKGEPSSMRVGSYKVPFSEGMGDLSITHFPGDGGGLEANINRWRGQVNLLPLSLDEIVGMAIYGQSDIGPYKIFKIINENNPSSAFLCSIIEAKNSTIFVKLNIPLKGVYELENDFKNFSSTFKYLEN